MRRENDHKEPKQILYYPTVAEFRFGYRAIHRKRLVVDIDQSHQA